MNLTTPHAANAPTQNETQPSPKALLEEKKLRLEIEELQKHWFKKPSFFVPIFGALSSFFILWVTGFFNTKIESLSNKREALTFAVDRLTNERNQLQEKKNKLALDSANLEKAKKSLIADTTALKQRADSLINRVHFLNRETLILNSKISKLSDDLKIATKPHLRIGDRDNEVEKLTGIYINNSGTGIAFFEQVKFIYNGNVFVWRKREDIYRILEAMEINEKWVEWSMKEPNSKMDSAGSLGPGQGYYILKVNSGNYSDVLAKRFMSVIQKLKIEISYYSTNGKKFNIQW